MPQNSASRWQSLRRFALADIAAPHAAAPQTDASPAWPLASNMKRGGRDGGLTMESLSVCAGVVLCIVGWTAIQKVVYACLRKQRNALRDAFETPTGVAGEEAAVLLLGP